ncbi:hypothetical protein [Nocardioides currus]|uniref:WXG100 family type VII secretion target n=1 Tax=Nocardioides currus TaxID=2133958 RepID=A0A2R7Z200_9ACTN|nr:hypothetical protein [Nocardioides currus]PUA82653.1 hypothetical protein C7S10_02675 [Nocardioides currus]
MRLEPKNIHELAADRMSDQAGWVGVAKTSYIPNNLASFDPGNEGLIGMLMHQHDGNVQQMLDNAAAGQRLLETVSGKLDELFALYEATDDDEAVRFGHLLDGLGGDPQFQSGPPLGTPGSPASFPPDPPNLRRAVPMEGIPDPVMMLIKMGGDFVSPSFYILGIIKLACGVDPIQWFTREMIGDYQSVSEAGDAVRALGEFYAQLSGHLTTDAGILFDRWQGVAADAATPYWREFTDLFAQQEGPYSEMAGQYDQFAWACFFGAQAVYDAITMLIDYAIETVLELIAGAAGLSTGPGDIAIVAIFEAWKAVTAIHGIVCASCFALVAVMTGIAASASSVSLSTFKDG